MKKLTVLLALFVFVAAGSVHAQAGAKKTSSQTEALHSRLQNDLVMMFRLSQEEAKKVVAFEAGHQPVVDGLKAREAKKQDTKIADNLQVLREKEKTALKAIIPEEKVYYVARFFSTNKAYIDTKGTL